MTETVAEPLAGDAADDRRPPSVSPPSKRGRVDLDRLVADRPCRVEGAGRPVTEVEVPAARALLAQRKPIEPLGTTGSSRLASQTTVFHSAFSPASPRSDARRNRPAAQGPSRPPIERDEERHVGVAPRVVAEVGDLALDVELVQDHVAHRHRQGAVGAGDRGQPVVGELGVPGVVG